MLWLNPLITIPSSIRKLFHFSLLNFLAVKQDYLYLPPQIKCLEGPRLRSYFMNIIRVSALWWADSNHPDIFLSVFHLFQGVPKNTKEFAWTVMPIGILENNDTHHFCGKLRGFFQLYIPVKLDADFFSFLFLFNW